MKRRHFIKQGAILVPTLLLTRKSIGQIGLQSPGFVGQLSKKDVGTSSKNPNDITGLVGWWKADALSLSDGDSVTTWPDSASVIGDLTSVNAPTFQTNEKNSLPIVRFDGVDDYLSKTLGHPSYSSPFSVVLVFRLYTSPTNLDVIIRWGGVFQIYPSTTWNIYNGTADVSVGSSIDTNWHILGIILNGASSKYRFDGGSWTAFSANPGTSSSDRTTIAAQDAGGGASCPLELGEIIRYDNAISESDGSSLFTTLNTKWAVY